MVRGTATKYTLLGKIDLNEQIKMTEDLMKSCQFVATVCVLIHEPSLGYSRAFRRHVKQEVHGFIHEPPYGPPIRNGCRRLLDEDYDRVRSFVIVAKTLQ